MSNQKVSLRYVKRGAKSKVDGLGSKTLILDFDSKWTVLWGPFENENG